MKYCKHCKVNISTERDYCPLCFRELSQETAEGGGVAISEIFPERKTNETSGKDNKFVAKLFIFMSICVLSASLLINLLVDADFLWSMYVVSGLVYLWIFIAHTIISHRGIFEKILLQVFGVMFVVGVSNYLSVDHTWLPDYVFPSLSMGLMLTMMMMTFCRKDKSWVLSFVCILMLLFIASIVVLVFFTTFKLVGIINTALLGLAIIGYFIFGYNHIRHEFLKIFHI